MSEKRKVWFITRPQRDPTFHAPALRALSVATNGFAEKWSGNRAIQKSYEAELIKNGLKRDHISESGSGGRTWVAMLQTFDYLYILNDGHIKLTKVGAALIEGRKIRENTIKQLLTLQIPNAYFSTERSGPQFEDDFHIRPIRFLLRVLLNPIVDRVLYTDEIVYFVLRSRNDNEIGSCLNSIRSYRRLSEEDRKHLRDELDARDDHRIRIDKDARGFRETNYDVATTFMLMASYIEFLKYKKSTSSSQACLSIEDDAAAFELAKLLDEYDKRYPFNTRYQISQVAMAENNGLDIDSYKAAYVSGVSQATTNRKLLRIATALISQNPSVNKKDRDSIASVLVKSGLFSNNQIESLTEAIYQLDLPQFGDEFISQYLSETDDRMFENETASLLELLDLRVFLRPKPLRGNGSNIEIIVIDRDGHLGLIDCKCYGNSFPLSAVLADYMGSEYIPDYEGFEHKAISFFAYVVLNEFSGETNLKKASDVAESIIGRSIPGFIVTAKSLLELVSFYVDQASDSEKKAFSMLKLAKNKGYRSFAELKSALFS